MTDSTALDNNPDARAKRPGEETPALPAQAPEQAAASLSPATVQAGSNGFTLTINGAGFTPNVQVLWNGAALPTKFVSPTQLTVSVPAKFIAVPGNVVVALNAGRIPTGSAPFTVTAAPERQEEKEVMSRILLADDSPHAQRMGELILREEGYEVVTITDGATVLLRLRDVDPDLVLVDVTMPTKSGYEICEYVKSHLRHVHTRVVLVAGAQDPVDDLEVLRVRADGVLKKPFEASVVLKP